MTTTGNGRPGRRGAGGRATAGASPPAAWAAAAWTVTLAAGCVSIAPGGRAPEAVPALRAPVTGLAPGRATAAAPPERAAGAWTGSYEGRTYGRAGALELELRETPDGLAGVVRLALPPAPPGRPLGASPGRTSAPRVAAVRLARAEARGDSVRLVTEPFWDSGCGCTATLSLTGRLRGDSLGGRFRAESAPTVAPERDGRWRVARAAPGRP